MIISLFYVLVAFGGEARRWLGDWVSYLLGFKAGVAERDRREVETREELLDGEYLPTLPTLPAIKGFLFFFLVYTKNNIT